MLAPLLAVLLALLPATALKDQPGFQRASVHVGIRGPGHLSRTGAASSSSPSCDAGKLDFSQSTGCSTALLSIL